MKNNPLVSIVMPAFNRADIIGETLDSVLAQTYQNWECVIVDDGSADATVEVIAAYAEKDSRIKLMQRPAEMRKGANVCRNIGLKNANGDYIIFFDSDDLMTPHHIAFKAHALQNSTADYIIAKTQYFNFDKDAFEQNYYNLTVKEISAFNYITEIVNWLTCDVCLRAELAKSIAFNEEMKSGQEYNYFSKLVLKSVNMRFFPEILSLRRYHQASIRGDIRKNEALFMQRIFESKWFTYMDIAGSADARIRVYLLYVCMDILLNFPETEIKNKNLFYKSIRREYGIRAAYFFIALLLQKTVKKGAFVFLHKLKAT